MKREPKSSPRTRNAAAAAAAAAGSASGSGSGSDGATAAAAGAIGRPHQVHRAESSGASSLASLGGHPSSSSFGTSLSSAGVGATRTSTPDTFSLGTSESAAAASGGASGSVGSRSRLTGRKRSLPSSSLPGAAGLPVESGVFLSQDRLSMARKLVRGLITYYGINNDKDVNAALQQLKGRFDNDWEGVLNVAFVIIDRQFNTGGQGPSANLNDVRAVCSFFSTQDVGTISKYKKRTFYYATLNVLTSPNKDRNSFPFRETDKDPIHSGKSEIAKEAKLRLSAVQPSLTKLMDRLLVSLHETSQRIAEAVDSMSGVEQLSLEQIVSIQTCIAKLQEIAALPAPAAGPASAVLAASSLLHQHHQHQHQHQHQNALANVSPALHAQHAAYPWLALAHQQRLHGLQPEPGPAGSRALAAAGSSEITGDVAANLGFYTSSDPALRSGGSSSSSNISSSSSIARESEGPQQAAHARFFEMTQNHLQEQAAAYGRAVPPLGGQQQALPSAAEIDRLQQSISGRYLLLEQQREQQRQLEALARGNPYSFGLAGTGATGASALESQPPAPAGLGQGFPMSSSFHQQQDSRRQHDR